MPDDPLTTFATQLAQTHEQVLAVRGIVERLSMHYGDIRHQLTILTAQMAEQHERLTRVEQTVAALKDLLERGQNGH